MCIKQNLRSSKRIVRHRSAGGHKLEWHRLGSYSIPMYAASATDQETVPCQSGSGENSIASQRVMAARWALQMSLVGIATLGRLEVVAALLAGSRLERILVDGRTPLLALFVLVSSGLVEVGGHVVARAVLGHAVYHLPSPCGGVADPAVGVAWREHGHDPSPICTLAECETEWKGTGG